MFKKIARSIVKVLVSSFAVLIIVLLVFDYFVQFRMSDDEVNLFFKQKHVPVKIGYYSTHGRYMRYLGVGKDTTATILFIHGAPSSSTYWRDYLTDSTLLHNSAMYAVDRPGYGSSGFGKVLPDIQQQAACIKPILDSLQVIHRPVVVVAASYGTAIACRLAMDYPNLVDGLVLVAPALAPGQEEYFFFTYIIENPLLHWFIPRMFKSANTEKVYHKNQLANMLPYWKNIHVPVMYIQGADDKLVFTSNAAFARQQLVNVPSLDIEFIPGKGHVIAFSEKKLIEKKILRMLEMVKKNAGK